MTHQKSNSSESRLDEFIKLRAEQQGRLPRIREEGEAALSRLLPIAQGYSGQCRYVAGILLSMYNGSRFKVDLTDFRCLDHSIAEDCLAVLRMDCQPVQEVHSYFENGHQIFEDLAKRWGIRDYEQDDNNLA